MNGPRGVRRALCSVALLTLTGAAAAQEPRATFRTAVDVIPVDVQVVAREGEPVANLPMDRFEVTVDGHARKVVSAEFIDYRMSGPGATRDDSGTSASAAAASDPPRTGATAGRIFILAVDASSFTPSEARPVLEGAADFVRRLQPDDEVGLFAFPGGPIADVTTDHHAVIRTLDTIVPRLEAPPAGEFLLGPGDLIELARSSNRVLVTDDSAAEIVRHFCPDPEDLSCPTRLDSEVRSGVLLYEAAARVTAGHLQDLMAGLARSPRRKTLVLVSGGLISSNEAGGRPNNLQMGLDIGRAAAQANVSVYSLFVDVARNRPMKAASRRAPSSFNPGFESRLQSQWLDDLAGSAGGSLLRVTTGDGQPAFARILRENSGVYLLGVESLRDDRDGRMHEIRVKVRDVRGATVRARSWVRVPRTGTPSADLVGSARTPAPSPAPPSRPAEPPVRRLPPPSPAVTALAEAFTRNDVAALERAVAAPDANGLYVAFRSSTPPWPEAPRRTAIFALDLAAAGLRTPSRFTRQEALRLLAEYMVRVRQLDDRTFECAWLWTATAALEARFEPEISTALVDRAASRCPDDANLRLARAVIHDQGLTMPSAGDSAPRASAIPEPQARVLEFYRLAADTVETREEAAIRAAALHLRADRPAAGLALLDGAPVTSGDRQLRYVHALVRGQLYAALGRFDDAAESFRRAADEFPDAPSAVTGMMTTAALRGDQAEAAALAERVLAADPARPDPWWLFLLGDYRAYDAIRAQLRSLQE